MSEEQENASSSTSNNNRIEPRFFNLNYHPIPRKKEQPDTTQDNNSHWTNPPPPYSPTVDENESMSTEPSAPPLELVYDNYSPTNYSNDHIPTSNQPINSPTQNQAPIQNQQQYGSINHNTSDTAWPRPRNNQGILQHHSKKPVKYRFIRFLIFFFCSILCLQILVYIFGGRKELNCYDGVEWQDLLKQFEFTEMGLRFRLEGGQVSGGKISIKRQPDKSGVVELHSKIYPPNLIKDPDLGFSLTRITNGTTIFEIFIPQSSHCIYLEVVIYVPYSVPLHELEISAPNLRLQFDHDTRLEIQNVFITSKNRRIDFLSQWYGETMIITTANAGIDIAKPILNASIVSLETSNGPIRIRDNIEANLAINLDTTNNDIDTDGVMTTAVLRAKSINGHIIHNQINVDRAEIKSTNGLLQVKHGNVKEIINIQTINERLNLNLDSCQYCQALAYTSNSDITVSMPNEYEGSLDIITTTYNLVKFSDELNWSKLHLVDINHIMGNRHRPGNTSNTGGRLQVSTVNANCHISFSSPKIPS